MKKQHPKSGFCDCCGRWKAKLNVVKVGGAKHRLCAGCDLIASGAPARAYAAAGIETISHAGEPLPSAQEERKREAKEKQ